MNDFFVYLIIGIGVVVGIIAGLFYVQSLTYTVSGYVRDFEGNPIENVMISFSNGYAPVYTNSNGYWTKNGLKGDVKVDAKKAGWRFTPAIDVNGNYQNANFYGIQEKVNGVFDVGNKPRDLILDPKDGKGYVSVSSQNIVDVFDLSTYNILKQINVGIDPWKMVFDPQNNMVYVANFGDNTVTVIDAKTDKVITNIKVGNEPLGIALNAKTNRIYVANNFDNTLSIIDASTNKVIGTVNVGKSPYGIAVDENNNSIYVTNSGDNTVSVINGSTNMVINTVKVGNNPSSVCIGNGIVYVLNESDGSISMIKNYAVIGTFNVGTGINSMTYDPSVNAIYLTNSKADSLIFLNAQTESIIRVISVGHEPCAVKIDQNLGEIYVVNYGSGTVSVIK
ncbi:YncE family protein [Athalassotoga saccharophila]|uniref:YncE family protein n=1 Tax=Athalassotoga saccharophila TaxID=1441386 RepID=UPI00137A71C5|nr:YncE family protein [Athalassotoga saccharophila]BBJ27906.1 PE-PGRS family protein PE_PGRS18 [Athalassotoga saccharophila]